MSTTNKYSDIHKSLREWFQVHGRDLPWRHPDITPWAILLSEVMSQQTPVQRVIPQWEAWLRQWPDPQSLSTAPTNEVLAAWGRLGYPRRALRLKECARVIVERHEGEVPSDVDDLLALPGIGTYTARAVACFAYGQNVPVVDTNVRRVYQRLMVGGFLAPPARARELAQVAAFLPPGADNPAGPPVSIALMELGALVCKAKSPACELCPVRQQCQWQELGCPAPSAEEASAAKKRVQKFQGTDRQVRGLIMAQLRETTAPEGVPFKDLELVWPDKAQWSRALFSLIDDGLAEEYLPGFLRLPR